MYKFIYKVILVLFTLIFTSANLYSQKPALIWSARYNSPANGDDRPSDMALDSAGNIYVTGLDAFTPGVITIKYYNSGQQQWLKRFTNHISIVSQPNKIKTDRFGNVYVLGHDSHGFLIKYDSTGVQKWVAQFTQFSATFSDIVVSKSGYIYVSGGTQRSNPFGDILLVKYNSLGDTVWMRTFNLSYRGAGASSIYLDDSNYVYITGGATQTTPIISDLICTMKYDSLGVMKWVSYYNNVENVTNTGKVIRGDSRGNIYTTGYIQDSSGSANFCTLKYSNDGTQKWVNIYRGVRYGGGGPKDMVVDSIGNVYVTGGSPDSAGNYNYATIKYDTAGNQSWVRRYFSVGYWGNTPTSIFLDKSQNCYITGSTATIKYNSEGIQQWIMGNPDPQSQYRFGGVKIIIDKNNSMIICADGDRDIEHFDILTLKYGQITGVSISGSGSDISYKLNQNYPNPFNPKTVISYQLSVAGLVTLKVFDVLGKGIETLVNENKEPGIYETKFDGTDLASGIYFYKLTTDYYSETRRMTLLK